MKTVKSKAKEKAVLDDIKTEKYLTFYIDSQLYCIPTSQVVEIIRMQPITFIPNVVDYVKGVINLRGKVVPVLDMRLRFKKEEKEYDMLTSIVIVEVDEKTVGMIVDCVKDVRDVSPGQISVTPKSKKSVGKEFVCGIVTLGKDSAMMLDTAKVLTHTSQTKADGKPESAKPAASAPQAV